MKRLIAFLLWIGMAGVAVADEPAPLNDPPAAWENFKKVLDSAQPSADYLYNAIDGGSDLGTSIRLYSLEGIGVPVIRDLDVRLGWFTEKGVYLPLSLNLQRATKIDLLRYAHVGVYGGKDFSGNKWKAGIVAGAKVDF